MYMNKADKNSICYLRKASKLPCKDCICNDGCDEYKSKEELKNGNSEKDSGSKRQ